MSWQVNPSSAGPLRFGILVDHHIRGPVELFLFSSNISDLWLDSHAALAHAEVYNRDILGLSKSGRPQVTSQSFTYLV